MGEGWKISLNKVFCLCICVYTRETNCVVLLLILLTEHLSLENIIIMEKIYCEIFIHLHALKYTQKLNFNFFCEAMSACMCVSD